MGKRKRLFGDKFIFKSGTKRTSITLLEIGKIQEELIKGERIYNICENFNISYGMYRVLNNEGYFAFCIESKKPITGRNSFLKKENDITEEELIIGIPKYNWKDLTRKEKEFYYKYNRLMKSNWSAKEINTVENYYHASDHEVKSEKWEYIQDMMDQSDFNYPKRSPEAYRSKMHKVWKEKETYKYNN